MNNKLTLVFLVLAAAPSLFAQEVGVQRSTTGRFSESLERTQQTGFAGYLTYSGGYTGVSSDLGVEGTPSSLKLLGSYVTENQKGVFDLGAGTQNQTFTSSLAQDSSTSSNVLELAARYQFASRWQLGAVVDSVSETGSTYGANAVNAAFGGVQILREVGLGKEFLGRIGARAMTSLNTDNTPVNMALVELQLGWGQTGFTSR